MNAVILARGGSKGVPDKNIADLGGKPLLGYPISAALSCKAISRVFVSTDSERISDVARKFGAEVIVRPAHLAGDQSLDWDAFKHVVQVLDDEADLIHLRATTPLIDADVLEKAIGYFNLHRNECTSMRSAHQFPESVYKFFFREGNFWHPVISHEGEVLHDKPRQQFPANYLPNGYVDVVRPKQFMDGDSFHGGQILAFETPYAHEVDSPEDLEYLRFLKQKGDV